MLVTVKLRDAEEAGRHQHVAPPEHQRHQGNGGHGTDDQRRPGARVGPLLLLRRGCAPKERPPTASATTAAPSQSKRAGRLLVAALGHEGHGDRHADRNQRNVDQERDAPVEDVDQEPADRPDRPRSARWWPQPRCRMPRPRSAPSKFALISASDVGTSSAPNAPCTSRATMSSSMFGASPQASDARPNPARPMMNKRLRPYRSASAPARISSADSESR